MVISEKVVKKLEFDKILLRLRDHCFLPMAKELADTLFPQSDLRTIRQLLRETDEARILLRYNPLFSVRGAKEIRAYLERCDRGGVLKAEELLEIKDTMKTGRLVKSTILDETNSKSNYAELYTLREIVHLIIPQKNVEDEINECISEDARVADNASPELARLRKAIVNIQQRIKDNLDSFLKNGAYQKMLQDRVITFRGDRYVIPVKQEYVSSFPGIVHDQSASGATLFIEPMPVVQLGNELRETQLRERREVQIVLQKLTALVAVKIEEISVLYEAISKLDFILAKALLSESMNAGSPIMINKSEIALVEARHPLLTGDVVPLTVELGKNYNFLVVTGPNTGGKTVALKTMGLMAIMAQSGLHIPAESDSRMGVFSHVFVDIGDEQSVEQSLSTFSGHKTNIVSILKEADEKSLILFDEIGAGTDPGEGAALAKAIIYELLERGCKGIVTTHYGSLKTFAYNTPGIENASVEFNSETLKPTYRLLSGIPGRSNALSIAARLGLGASVLDKARTYISERETQETDLLENLEETQREMELEKLRIIEERRETRQRLEALEKKATELKDKNEEEVFKAREEAAEIVRVARQDAERIIKEIKESQKKDRKDQLAAMEKSRQGLKKLSDNIYGSIKKGSKSNLRPDQIEPGMTVYMPNIRQKGQVLTKPDSSKEVVVQAGILKVSVPISEIRIIDETRKPENLQKSILGNMGLNKAITLRSEIDLRGKYLDESEELLDKYLDDALLTGINQVSVIHGKGTGALRTGIHKFLKKNARVASFRLGEFGEGDSGVTIVQLK